MGAAETKIAFAESFRAIAAEKPVDRITVGEICASAGRSPATFYRHFRDKYELAAWEYAQASKRIMERLGPDYPWSQTLLDGMAFHWERRVYLKNLLEHTWGHDSFVRNMTQNTIALLDEAASRLVGQAGLSDNLLLCVEFYSHGMIQLICEWVLGRFESTPERMASVVHDCLPEPLNSVL